MPGSGDIALNKTNTVPALKSSNLELKAILIDFKCAEYPKSEVQCVTGVYSRQKELRPSGRL